MATAKRTRKPAPVEEEAPVVVEEPAPVAEEAPVVEEAAPAVEPPAKVNGSPQNPSPKALL